MARSSAVEMYGETVKPLLVWAGVCSRCSRLRFLERRQSRGHEERLSNETFDKDIE